MNFRCWMFLSLIFINVSISGMRYARTWVSSINRPLMQAATQRRAPSLHRLYATDAVERKYSKVLIDSLILKKNYFNNRRLSSYNDYEDDFRISKVLLQHMMVEAKTSDNFPVKKLVTLHLTNSFERLHEKIAQSEDEYATLRVLESKSSLFLLLRHIRWDGTMKELEVYPERREFPIVLNGKEGILTFVNKVHSKSYFINGLFINCHGASSQDQVHNKKIIETYERLFVQKGTC